MILVFILLFLAEHWDVCMYFSKMQGRTSKSVYERFRVTSRVGLFNHSAGDDDHPGYLQAPFW